jgi:hypothetical protein
MKTWSGKAMFDLARKFFCGLAVVIGMASAQKLEPWIAERTPALEQAVSRLPQASPGPLAWDTLGEIERLELLGIQTQMFSPPRAARALALLSVALNDTLALLGEAGAERNVALAYAAQEVMLYLHPTFPNLKDGVRETVADIRAKAEGAGVAKEVLQGSARVGFLVGRRVVDFARKDGYSHQAIPQYPPAAPGVWVLPLGRPAAEPGWGQLTPIGIAKDQLAEASPPPAWDSPEYEQERKLFWEEQKRLDDKGREIADKWAGDPGTVTPAGLWQELAVRMLRDKASSPEAAVNVLASLNVAMHDAFIACWKAKFTYYTARPNQWVSTFDKTWKPYLRTPRFPAYPSGHSTVSGAAARVLEHYFPGEATLFEGMAQEASYSRIIAGIHWFVDSKNGLDLGRRVAEQVLKGR